MVKVIIYPIMAFAGLSFGLDWHGKRDANSSYDDPYSDTDGMHQPSGPTQWGDTGEHQRTGGPTEQPNDRSEF